MTAPARSMTGATFTVAPVIDLHPVPLGEPLPSWAVQDAQLLAGAVRDHDPETVEKILTHLGQRDLYAIAVTLAALVPVDTSPTELLAWNDSSHEPHLSHSPRILQPHGTHAGYVRHRNNGEIPCDTCKAGQRDYDRGRHRRKQAGLT